MPQSTDRVGDPHSLERSDGGGDRLDRATGDRLSVYRSHEEGAPRRNEVSILGRQAGRRVEPGLEPPVQLAEVLADAPARGRARRIDPFDPKTGELQEPMDLRHRRDQARALRGRQCIEQGGGGLVRAPIHLSHFPPPCRRQASLADALVLGTRAQPDETLSLEGADQAAHIAGIEPESLAQVAEVGAPGADLVQQP